MSVEPVLREADPVEPSVARDAPQKASFALRVATILVPALICLAGVGVAAVFVATRPHAGRTAHEERGVPVRATPVEPSTQPVRVRAHGTVVAAQKVTLQPELNGRIVWMSDDLVPGGRVHAGDTLIRIDPRDYRAQVEQSRAQVEQSRLGIAEEQSRAVIAEREWELLRRQHGGSESGRELALREPHLRTAEAQLRAARSSMRQARTNLSRTTLDAPFDAFVESENADLGQLVGPTSQLATLVGTDRFWVQVSIPMERLAWIQVPGVNGEDRLARPRPARGRRGRRRLCVQGRVVRLLGDLDPVGRMARVLVAIDDPLGLHRDTAAAPGDPSSLPILLGAFVRVEIEAGELSDVYRDPADAPCMPATWSTCSARTTGSSCREVDVVWRRARTVLVRGLHPGRSADLRPASRRRWRGPSSAASRTTRRTAGAADEPPRRTRSFAAASGTVGLDGEELGRRQPPDAHPRRSAGS